MATEKLLLIITELGGYPDFSPIYKAAGYSVVQVTSMRKALKVLKNQTPSVIVAEFNFQSDFRDRTSSLETLIAVVERLPDTKIIVFYEKEYAHQFERLKAQYDFHAELPFPIDTELLTKAVEIN